MADINTTTADLTAKTNSLLGGDYFNASTGAAIKPFVPGPINSGNLAPTNPIPYVSPTVVPPPVPPAPAPDPTALTAPETKAQDLSTQLQDLNNQLTGKADYTTQQSDNAGITALQKTQTDLSTQLKELTNEAQAIPQQLQVDATGRGITAGGLAPLQTARLRTNAIQALGISSLLDSTNGLLASAQAKVDKAVAAKYDPIQAQIDAATKNLSLIMNSPDYSLAEKKRAAAQQTAQEQKQYQLDQARQDTQTIYTIATEAAKSGANAQVLQQIQQATSPLDAIRIATAAGVYSPATTSGVRTLRTVSGVGVVSIQPDGSYKVLVPIGTSGTSGTTGTSGGTVVTHTQLNPILANVGLPLTVADSKGALTQSSLSNIVKAGVPLEIVQGIWANIASGTPLEEIRAGMVQQFGWDQANKYLDAFMQTLQGGSSGGRTL